MQVVATRKPVAAVERPRQGSASTEPDIALCDLIRARSVVLGDRAYVEHARADASLSFRQLEQRMEQWRAVLGGVRARGLTTIGLLVEDPVAFADAFLGVV